jgi:tocopherol cyclase
MECYHGVVSLDHALRGVLEIDGQHVPFDDGRGYIEKDWGTGFPRCWVWCQSNHFEQPGVSLTASIAHIPWRGHWFAGFIIGVWLHGRLYRFATYTGAKVERLCIGEPIEWVVRGRDGRLELRLHPAHTGSLHAPGEAGMGRRVAESLTAKVEMRLTGADGKQLYEGTGRISGLEVVGDVKVLETGEFMRT